MGLYWRKSTKILPGVRINWSKSGPSMSVGPRGAKVNFGKRGTYVSGGIPGTGLYYRQKLGGKKRNQSKITPNSLSNSNSNVVLGLSPRGCCFAFLFVIAFALLITGNILTCLLYIFLVGVIVGICYLIKVLQSKRSSISSTPNIDNSTSTVDTDKDNTDVKMALTEVDQLISLIDNSTDKVKLPSYYRQLMGIVLRIEKNGEKTIHGLPIAIFKNQLLEKFRKRMNA